MSYSRYETLKAQWVKDHPDATPKQYQQAMQRIAKVCKV